MDAVYDEAEMNQEASPTRVMMVRDIAIFQTKLLADGLRDGMLVPVSLAAGVLGLISKKPTATRIFYDVLKLGLRTERWIDLFGSVSAQNVDALHNSVTDMRRALERRGVLDGELKRSLESLEDAVENIEGSRLRYRQR